MQFLTFIIYSGGYDGSTRNEILEFDPENWTKISTMREERYRHAVSVVNYEDYAEYCQE